MTTVRILLLLLLAYVIFAIATLPASFATRRINAALADVEVNAVDGSIWSGSADAINYQGVALGALEWSARPAAIFRGEWRNHLLLDGVVTGEGELGVALDGVVQLYDATLHTSLAELNRSLAKRLPPQAQQLRGGVDAEIKKFAVEPRGRELRWLDGDFAVTGLRLGEELYLGDFAATVTTVGEQRFRSEVRSTGDRGLQLRGVVTTDLQGDVELDIEIANVELFGERAAGLLRRLMQKTEQGYYRLRWQGNIRYLLMLFGQVNSERTEGMAFRGYDVSTLAGLVPGNLVYYADKPGAIAVGDIRLIIDPLTSAANSFPGVKAFFIPVAFDGV